MAGAQQILQSVLLNPGGATMLANVTHSNTSQCKLKELMKQNPPRNDININTSHEKDDKRDQHFQKFQSWATKNYGENSKTKTVTRRKYGRIVTILTGEESPNSENAKFRFWVKAKGFKLGPSNWRNGLIDSSNVLYVPTKVQNAQGTRKEYKKVAIIEEFFNIIYSMHVDADSRGGKHAGQKRTYRAIAETYAFLPREAVTRFLMSCSDCQKRMYLTMEPDGKVVNTSLSGSTSTHREKHLLDYPRDSNSCLNLSLNSNEINFNIPITTTYINNLKRQKRSGHSQVSPVDDWNGTGNDMCKDTSSKALSDCFSKTEEYIDIDTFEDSRDSIKDEINCIRTHSQILTEVSATKKEIMAPTQCGSTHRKAEEVVNDYTDPEGNHTEKIQVTQQPQIHPISSSKLIGKHHISRTSKTASTKRSHPYLRPETQTSDDAYYSTPISGLRLSRYSHEAIPKCDKEYSTQEENIKKPQESSHNDTLTSSTLSASLLPLKTMFMSSQALSYVEASQSLSIHQMILGYRESAAFLYRSAEELERLLIAYS